MLISNIDKKFRNYYNFFYLPIDFKNKCNMGYAFINFTSYNQIPRFYKFYDGKRWEKFNSEKICALSYARIQGYEQLKLHFQYS